MVKIGFGKNIKLTAQEFNDLKTTFGVKQTNEQIKKLDDYITTSGKEYVSHFETLKEWLNNTALGKTADDGSIVLEYLRSKYHRVLCKCGKKMQFVGFDGEKVEGLVPSAFYKCACGINAYEKVYTNQDMVVVYFGKDEKPSIATLHDLAEIELLAVNIEEMERLLNEG